MPKDLISSHPTELIRGLFELLNPVKFNRTFLTSDPGTVDKLG